MLDFVIYGGVFVACAGVFLVVIYAVFYRDPVKGRLEKMSGIHGQKESAVGRFNYFLAEIMKYFGRVGQPKEKERIFDKRMALFKAGFRGKNATPIFFGAKTFLVLLFPIITWALISVFADLTNVRTMFYVIVAAGIGFYLPELWIRSKTKKRIEQIREGFPDVLDLLVVCTEAGQGMDAALDRVGREVEMTNAPLSEEFRLLNLEIRAGKSRKEALRNLVDRTGLDDISSLVTLINQSEELGVSISQTLRVHSDSMRTKRQMRAEAMAGRIPVKLTIPLVLFIFPCIFVVVVGPGVISIIRHLL